LLEKTFWGDEIVFLFSKKINKKIISFIKKFVYEPLICKKIYAEKAFFFYK